MLQLNQNTSLANICKWDRKGSKMLGMDGSLHFFPLTYHLLSLRQMWKVHSWFHIPTQENKKKEKSISTKTASTDWPVTVSWAVQNVCWTDLPWWKKVKISVWEGWEGVEIETDKEKKTHVLQTAAKVSPFLYPPTIFHPLFSFYSGSVPSSLPVSHNIFFLVIPESLPLVLSSTPSVIQPKYLLPQVRLFHHLLAKSAKQGNGSLHHCTAVAAAPIIVSLRQADSDALIQQSHVSQKEAFHSTLASVRNFVPPLTCWVGLSPSPSTLRHVDRSRLRGQFWPHLNKQIQTYKPSFNRRAILGLSGVIRKNKFCWHRHPIGICFHTSSWVQSVSREQ